MPTCMLELNVLINEFDLLHAARQAKEVPKFADRLTYETNFSNIRKVLRLPTLNGTNSNHL